MPEPTRVWMVPLGRGKLQEIPGTLSLGDDSVVFEAKDGSFERRFGFSDIRRSKRVHGSPVLIVVLGDGQTAFYFTQPPPLKPEPADPTGRVSPFEMMRGGRKSKRKHVRTNATYLSSTNAAKKNEVKSWLAAIRERAGN